MFTTANSVDEGVNSRSCSLADRMFSCMILNTFFLKKKYFSSAHFSVSSKTNIIKIFSPFQSLVLHSTTEHMQDFIDKFRYNAKRAALVQSRIKAIEKMEVVEEVKEEDTFTFSFPDPGTVGPPVIQVSASRK